MHTGDVFAAYRFPFIDIGSGGSVKGVIHAMDVLLNMIDDQTKVIPGHGPVATRQDVLAYRKLMETVGGPVEEMMKKARTWARSRLRAPFASLVEQWGKFRKPDDFVELVYFSYAMNPQK